MLKKIYFFMVMLALFIMPFTTSASDPMEENVFIPADRVIEHNYFKTGNSFDISGTLEKDAYVLGNIVSVDGTIKGDLFGAANTLRINGKVEGSVRFVASNIIINGEVGENVMVATNTLIMNNDSKVGWELLAAGSMVELNGEIGGNTKTATAVVSVDGKISGDLDTQAAQLVIKDGSEVTGNVSYLSETEYEQAENVVIGGEVNVLENKVASEKNFKNLQKIMTGVLLLSFLSALLIAIIMGSFMPKKMHEVADEIKENFWHHFGMGLLFVIATPIVSVILMITVIGFPLAVIVLVSYFIILYLAKIFFALALMKLIFKWFKQKKEWHIILMLLVGLMIYYLISVLPLIGWLIGLFASATTFSALMVVKKKILQG